MSAPKKVRESKVSLKECIVMPFDVNAQYMIHLLSGLTVDDSLLLAWAKYITVCMATELQIMIKSDYVIKADEVLDVANSFKKSVEQSAIYTGNLTTGTHPGLHKHLKTVNLMVPMAYSYQQVVDKFTPEYKFRSDMTLGSISELIHDISPVISLSKVTKGSLYDRDMVERYAEIEGTLSLTKHDRKLIYERAFTCFSIQFHKEIIAKRCSDMGGIASTMASLRNAKCFATSGGNIARASYNVILDTMEIQEISNIYPLGVIVGMYKLLNYFIIPDSGDVFSDEADKDIILTVQIALLIVARFIGKIKLNTKLAISFAHNSDLDAQAYFSDILSPILKKKAYAIRKEVFDSHE